MFDKVLIANRGEIACRIIGTCRRLGIASVAVYSDADADARHVRLADEGRRIGPAPARESYLDIERLLETARRSGARAIHPGYGFLSENPQFAQRTRDAGLVFIGPPVAAMQAMSSKATARELMLRSGVPVLPGYQGERQEEDWLQGEAARIGYPVLIKAVAGGGGKGMRAVGDAAGFAASLASCRREAQASFGDAGVLLEKYLPAPRHIEVQIFGDAAGQIVHLYERDCSAQRRHQKVLEEAPAPQLRAAQREALTRAACEAARAVGYTGAGTVEFLLDAEGRHYFIEMNTRIQVEHAVTEMITGIDLVEWQLRVAAGEPLPLSQAQIRPDGHAIEVRLYAEQPEAGFLPSGGTLERFDLPAAAAIAPAQLRVESGVDAGDRVGIDYDPMLAKLIVHAATREQAIAALQAALSGVRIGGVGNNLEFLRRLVASASLRAGRIDTGFIERELGALLGADAPADARALPPSVLAAAALWTLEQERVAGRGPSPAAPMLAPAPSASPWQLADGWRLNALLRRTLHFELAGSAAQARDPDGAAVGIDYRPQGPWLDIAGCAGDARLTALGEDAFEVRFADQSCRLQLYEEGGELHIGVGLAQYRLHRRDPLRIRASAQAAAGSLTAPMPGRILAQLCTGGQVVTKGTPLLIMEAMKMEHTLCAPADGTVRAYHAAVGEQVQEGALLIDFEPQA